MAAQLHLSCQMGYVTKEQVERVVKLLKRAGLPTEIPEYIDREALVKKLYTDKKVRDGKLRMVFQKEIGDVMCFGDNDYAKQITEPEIAEVIDEM